MNTTQASICDIKQCIITNPIWIIILGLVIFLGNICIKALVKAITNFMKRKRQEIIRRQNKRDTAQIQADYKIKMALIKKLDGNVAKQLRSPGKQFTEDERRHLSEIGQVNNNVIREQLIRSNNAVNQLRNDRLNLIRLH